MNASSYLNSWHQRLLLAAVACLFCVASPAAVWAQGEEDDLAAEMAAAGAGEAPDEQVPAGGDGAAAGGGDAAADGQGPAGEDGDSETKAPSSMLAWTYNALGPGYMIIFLALSVFLLTLTVMNLLSVRQDNICPPDLVEGVEQELAGNNPQGAAELIRTDDSFLGQVVAAGLSRLDRGHSQAVEAMQEVGEEETMKLEHNLSYMALIGNISPMIGLFGTVQGMIAAFQTIAMSETTPKPSQLAMNISTALFTTLAGLAIAIPAIAVYNILRNRVQRMTLQVGVTSEELLERFQG